MTILSRNVRNLSLPVPYGKKSPPEALVHRARGSMRDAMSPRESQSVHTQRHLLSIAIGGQDRLLLLMVSIILPSVKRNLGWTAEKMSHVYREHASAVKREIVSWARSRHALRL